ncbi:hypothetical protein [Aequorivita aquimaris]|nr:hypothetical protein [Aequorivita aquimaris]
MSKQIMIIKPFPVAAEHFQHPTAPKTLHPSLSKSSFPSTNITYSCASCPEFR